MPKVDEWFTKLGFVHGNPFEQVNAKKEQDLLPNYFVGQSWFDALRTRRTTVIYGQTGCGKTASRFQLTSELAPQNIESSRLAVEYAIHQLLQENGKPLTAPTLQADHSPRLLGEAVRALVRALRNNPTRIEKLQSAVKTQLTGYMNRYYPHFFKLARFYSRFQELDARWTCEFHAFRAACRDNQLSNLISAGELATHPLANFFAYLYEERNEYELPDDLPLESLWGQFFYLVQEIGYDSLVFLVDGVDEIAETAHNPQAQVQILRPLFDSLWLIENPVAYFKFFVPTATYLELRKYGVRFDRIDYATIPLLNKEQLKELLDLRLAIYQYGTEPVEEKYSDFSFLCINQVVGKEIEVALLGIARGSPRRLLLAAECLCQVHVERSGAEAHNLISLEDWQVASARFLQKYPERLQLDPHRPVVRIEHEEISLTPIETALLLLLASGKRYRREELIQEVWNGVCADDAFNLAIRRLREKIEHDIDQPIFLVHEGRGKNAVYWLENYELEGNTS